MKLVLMAAMGGAIGAAGRYLVSVGVIKLIGTGFPWGTLIVNVAGSFIMGLMIEAIALRYSVSNEFRTFLATGVLGGFTTFSAFSLDFAVLMERRDEGLAAVYLGASVGLSILALFAGLYVARTFLQ
ncbi:MAG TPA: fluoride efflux transporter CrcB [Rhizobiales bacterium]|nr:putative fluoride ion transporter CrcB [bacterium BMS3Bbin10]HDO52005.1 fluoride efflux transporter CrcB [Hyphomicrobiales bacterium]